MGDLRTKVVFTPIESTGGYDLDDRFDNHKCFVLPGPPVWVLSEFHPACSPRDHHIFASEQIDDLRKCIKGR